jgi:hypothetical protein
MLAACGAVARSDEALEAVAAACRRAAIPAPASRLVRSRLMIVVRRFPAPCGGIFRMQQKDLALQPAISPHRAAHGATRG